MDAVLPGDGARADGAGGGRDRRGEDTHVDLPRSLLPDAGAPAAQRPAPPVRRFMPAQHPRDVPASSAPRAPCPTRSAPAPA